MAMDGLFRADRPVIGVRGVHLDLKGVPPTFDRLIQLLDVFVAARYNAVLVEWEDMFPWTVDDRFRCETAYSADEVRQFHAEAADRGLQVIPLVQCLGHMETPLSLSEYAKLREVPHVADTLNPLAEGARQLVESMVDDVLALTPQISHLHLGGDEAWSFGTHPDTKAYIQKHGKGALYLHHVEPILDKLSARGVRPILWHDMMIEWDDAALRALSRKADLMVWGYHGHPDQCTHHYATKHIQRFHDLGVTMWGGTAYKGAEGEDVDRPNVPIRQTNALAWAEVAQRFRMKGVVATAWSRYSTHRVQNEPIDAAFDSLVNVGVILHDGEPPAVGAEGCVAALAEISEKDRHEACRAAMRRLADARNQAWHVLRCLHQQVTMQSLDARRSAAAKGAVDSLKHLTGLVAELGGAAQQVHESFAGLIDKLWIDRYLAERIQPLRQQLAWLDPVVKTVDPAGYQAVIEADKTCKTARR